MQQRLVAGGLVVVRIVLVAAALVVALLPIGRSAISGFCPQEASAEAPVVVALGDDVVLAETGPADPDVGEGVPPATEEEAACGTLERCFPPLISAVVSFGDARCSTEAAAMLRGSMFPAFAIGVVLLAGAWLLRPRHGAALVGRW